MDGSRDVRVDLWVRIPPGAYLSERAKTLVRALAGAEPRTGQEIKVTGYFTVHHLFSNGGCRQIMALAAELPPEWSSLGDYHDWEQVRQHLLQLVEEVEALKQRLFNTPRS